MNQLFESLNPVQLEAVKHNEGPLLLLAGAGSGKTRVITYRIAHLIQDHGISPFNILAVTFTNKAADEMKKRIDHLVGDIGQQVWASTFHSSCARILRRNINQIGYDRSFTIYDSKDQMMLIKDVLKTLQVDAKLNQPKAIQNRISMAKNRFIGPDEYAEKISGQFPNNPFEETMPIYYKQYQKQLRDNNALDFDDLIVLTVDLFNQSTDTLEYYQDKFRYIMVDEYQDTNHCQYLLVRALAAKHHNICVVGDDDQSIYSFRGADINNILDFEKDYPEVTTMRLEQNYRSTKNILDAANEVIGNNDIRKPKRLWTGNQTGTSIGLYRGFDENDEANYIIKKITERKRLRSTKYSDCAIFYRTNAQSRAFEEALRYENIPYQIIGGHRFYERMEVKDVLAYLKLIVNPVDTVSLRRIINVPRRGIGATSLGRLEGYARQRGISTFEAIEQVEAISEIRAGTQKRIREFGQLIKLFQPSSSPLSVIIDLLEASDYLDQFEKDGSVEARSRIENIKELVSAIARYEEIDPDATLAGFLESVTLASDIDGMKDESDVVTLMTLHSAKGLEFPVVFMVGVEEGLLPHINSIGSKEELEEERRLCYVGITRAQKQLYIANALRRRTGRDFESRVPSRFIDEIPPDLFDQTSEYQPPERKLVSSFDPDEEVMDGGYFVGQIVFHVKFGRGRIARIIGVGGSARITVRFDRSGERTLMAQYANLQIA